MSTMEATMRDYQKDIEAGIREAHREAARCKRNIPQRWIVVCRVNSHGDVSVVDGQASVCYLWDADGWHVVAEFDTNDITPLKEALERFRREVQS